MEDAVSSRPDAWAAAAYCAAAGGGGCGAEARAPVFSAELGLAIEAPREAGTTVQQLWCVL